MKGVLVSFCSPGPSRSAAGRTHKSMAMIIVRIHVNGLGLRVEALVASMEMWQRWRNTIVVPKR